MIYYTIIMLFKASLFELKREVQDYHISLHFLNTVYYIFFNKNNPLKPIQIS